MKTKKTKIQFLRKMVLLFGAVLFFLFLTPFFASVHAISFSLIAPTPPAGGFKAGDTLQFQVTIDTEGQKVTTTQVGVNYESQYLSVQSVTKGTAFSTITYTTESSSKILISGSESAGFTGTGAYAYINFKIIAQAPGSTQLCSLYVPTTTPTTPPQATPTFPPGTTPLPTNIPTQLPKTGVLDNTYSALPLIGFILIGIPLIIKLAFKNSSV